MTLAHNQLDVLTCKLMSLIWQLWLWGHLYDIDCQNGDWTVYNSYRDSALQIQNLVNITYIVYEA